MAHSQTHTYIKCLDSSFLTSIKFESIFYGIWALISEEFQILGQVWKDSQTKWKQVLKEV